jgi:hypothetical protein
MNIFALDDDPSTAARWHFDKHVVKMILESSQMLCTSLHLNTDLQDIPYKIAHPKHPCSIWAAASRSNYSWLCQLTGALNAEYTYRYHKIHKCSSILDYCLGHIDRIQSGLQTPFAQAMPDEFKDVDSIQAYRNFYDRGKRHIKTVWTGRELPPWWSV